MITKSLDVVLSNPGVWVAMTNVVALIEVDPGGTCHALNLQTLERDRVLAPGGWCLGYGLQFIGPMARAAQAVREPDYDGDRP